MGPVLQEIDRFFGLKQVFWLAQFVPYRCLVIVNNRFCCPPVQLGGEPVESELSTRQAKHWMEGLSQKEWTLVTQCLILVLAERTKCPSRLLGQGDNQMNLIQPPRATVNIETFSRNYLDELGRLAADGGLQLKKEETWISTILFEYGKRFYIHGAPVSSALKRASKVSVEGNTGISTLSSEIASVFSNGVAIAGSDHTPVCGYFCSLVAGAFILHERDRPLGACELAAILLVTRHLGGFPHRRVLIICIQRCYGPSLSLSSPAQLKGPRRRGDSKEDPKDFKTLDAVTVS